MMSEKIEMTQKSGDASSGNTRKFWRRSSGALEGEGGRQPEKRRGADGHTAQEGGTTVIKIEPTQPQMVYAPTYNPATVGRARSGVSVGSLLFPGYVAGAAVFMFMAGVIVGNALGVTAIGGAERRRQRNKYNNFNRTNIRIQTGARRRAPQGVQYAKRPASNATAKGNARAWRAANNFAVVPSRDAGYPRGGADQFKGGGGQTAAIGLVPVEPAMAGRGRGNGGRPVGWVARRWCGRRGGDGGGGDGADAFQAPGAVHSARFRRRGAASHASSVGRGGGRAGGLGGGGGGRGGGGGGRR